MDRKITKQDVQGMLAKAYKKKDVLDIKECRGGFSNDVYEIICPPSGTNLIVKIYDNNYPWRMEKELYVYNLLCEHTQLPVPEVLGYDLSQKVVPLNYLILSKLKGQMLSDVKEDLKSKELQNLYIQLGEVLKKIHSITFDVFGYIVTEIVDSYPTNAEYMHSMFEKNLKQYIEISGNSTIADKIYTFINKNQKLLNYCPKACLCHNDYHESNFMVLKEGKEWKVSGIIDVENALAGDPLLDIAKLFYYSVKGNDYKAAGFMKGYGNLSDAFEERLQIYQLYQALELWNWFASQGQEKALMDLENDILRFSSLN